MSLFDGQPEGSTGTLRTAPLAERMRPRTLEEYSGQEHLLGPGKPLRVQIERDELDSTTLGSATLGSTSTGSMILWGPPGVGKTTLAKIIAETTKANFIEFSAVMSGIKEIKQVMSAAAQAAEMHSRTILFVDEIHRFNKAQQDAFLPYVERGTIRLIGATTENPSFEIISALLSRCRVYVLQPLSEERITALLRRALEDEERGLGALKLTADNDALELIASYSSGDCRSAYNTLEVAAQLAQEPASKKLDRTVGPGFSPDIEPAKSTRALAPEVRSSRKLPESASSSAAPKSRNHIDKAIAVEAVQQRVLMYDKSGEEHYNLISALHKSVRNSDPDASLYWLARMFAAGEDPLYLARRVVRMAVEDIGLAAPEALNLCLSAKQAMEFLGSPEGDLALAEAVVYLALAPKSNSVYTAWSAVQEEIEHTRQEPVPLHLRNAPTRLMKELDYGKGYRYAHDEEGRVADMDCLPESLKGRIYYKPTQEGREKQLAQRMEEIRRIRTGKRNSS
ncbi:MAG TPA: replication-associated recombination protein A [Terracidiphilus sp.]|jgi:putative ATPase|nr:replication-associated recombination protein A [Terracidiphilus sp.]